MATEQVCRRVRETLFLSGRKKIYISLFVTDFCGENVKFVCVQIVLASGRGENRFDAHEDEEAMKEEKFYLGCTIHFSLSLPHSAEIVWRRGQRLKRLE